MSTFPTTWHRPHVPAEHTALADWPWQKMGYVYHRGRWYFERCSIWTDAQGYAKGHIRCGDGEMRGYLYAWAKAPVEARHARQLIDYMTAELHGDIAAWLDGLPQAAHERIVVTLHGERREDARQAA